MANDLREALAYLPQGVLAADPVEGVAEVQLQHAFVRATPLHETTGGMDGPIYP